MHRLLTLLALGWFVNSPLARSETPTAFDREQKPCEIWGQITGTSRLLQEGLDLELVGLDGVAKQKVHVLANGNFDFRSVPPGDYQFRVTDVSGAIVYQQTKSLGGNDDFVLLVVRDPNVELAARNTVSFSALQHQTPQRAWNAFRVAQKAHTSGNTDQSIQRLQEALLIDPDFPEAHSDLAAIYAQIGRTEEALQHAQTAFSLNPQLPEAGCNVALLLVSLKRYQEAESVARRMLSGQYHVSVLHGVLAISLLEQRKEIKEALDHLRQAVTEFPFVRLLAAHALAEIGRSDLALIQAREYLQSSAHDCERPALEAWVRSVQAQLTLNK